MRRGTGTCCVAVEYFANATYDPTSSTHPPLLSAQTIPPQLQVLPRRPLRLQGGPRSLLSRRRSWSPSLSHSHRVTRGEQVWKIVPTMHLNRRWRIAGHPWTPLRAGREVRWPAGARCQPYSRVRCRVRICGPSRGRASLCHRDLRRVGMTRRGAGGMRSARR